MTEKKPGVFQEDKGPNQLSSTFVLRLCGKMAPEGKFIRHNRIVTDVTDSR